MYASAIPAPLRDKLGDSATAGFLEVMEAGGKEWKTDMLAIASDRFERRLAEECGAMRVEMTDGFASVRVEIIKWSFAFWVTQIVALGGIIALLMRA